MDSDHGHDGDHGQHHTHQRHVPQYQTPQRRRAGSWWHRVSHLITPHSHDSADKLDPAMETSRDGIRALWISLAVLGVTAAVHADHG
ncbi:MAG: cation diffusion facilitator family transporter, partial [Pseudonocardiaceae bacterium]